MQSDLDILIDYYQGEIIRLNQLIKENLEMHHYREIEFDEKALRSIQAELSILLELKIPNFRKIEKLKNEICYYKKIIEENKYDNFIHYPNIRIVECEKELENIKGLPDDPLKLDSEKLDNALVKLNEGSINYIKIHLSERLHLKLESITLNCIKITLNPEHGDVHWLKKYSMISNFNFSKVKNSLDYSMEVMIQNKNNLLPLKEKLSRLVFGLIHYTTDRNTVYLEIN